MKYLIAALAALASLLGGGLYIEHTRAQRAVADAARWKSAAVAATLAHSASNRALDDYVRKARARTTATKDMNNAKDNALAASSTWASTPLPTAVADWLREYGATPCAAPSCPPPALP
jgi:hypothetical protein